SAAYDQAVTVNYATQDYSAKVSDNDYVATSGTLTFSPGQTSKTISVTIKGDRKKEADETFYVLLSAASSNATIDNAYGWGTIVNDDRGGQNNAPTPAAPAASGVENVGEALLAGGTHSPSISAAPSAVVRTRKAAAVEQVIAGLGGKPSRSGLRIPEA